MSPDGKLHADASYTNSSCIISVHDIQIYSVPVQMRVSGQADACGILPDLGPPEIAARSVSSSGWTWQSHCGSHPQPGQPALIACPHDHEAALHVR